MDEAKLAAFEAGVRRDYGADGRHYHALSHLDDCLRQLDQSRLDPCERRLLRWALLWHDVVYDPTRPDNEEKSAERAGRELREAGVAEDEVAEVERLIRLTSGHRVIPDDARGALLVSIDLSILGAEPDRYEAYAAAIRREYAHVPEEAWRNGRARVLRHFLEGPAIFPDPDYRKRLEERARRNLERELAALEADGS